MGVENGGFDGSDGRANRRASAVANRFAPAWRTRNDARPNEGSAVDKGITGISSEVASDAVDSCLGDRKPRKIIVSGRSTVPVDANPDVSGGNGGFGSNSAGAQPVLVIANAGTALLRDALHRGSLVTVIKPDRKVGRRVVTGFVSLKSSSSGYAVVPLRGDGRKSSHSVDIEPSDQVILSEHYHPDPNEVSVVGSMVNGAVKAVSEKRAYDMNLSIGRFLDMIDGGVNDMKMKWCVQRIQRIRMEDVLAIVEKVNKDEALSTFLRKFLNFGKKSEHDLQSAVDEFSKAKNLSEDPATGQYLVADAVYRANLSLRSCVPTPETNEKGITFMDHGAAVQIVVTGDERRVVLPDFREGDGSCRDELFALHARAKGMIDKTGCGNRKILLEALLFQYYGVSLKDIASLGIQDVLSAIATFNKIMNKLGLTVYVNNGVAVLGEFRKPTTLLADCTDARAYKERFAEQVVGTLDDARAVYAKFVSDEKSGISLRSGSGIRARKRAAITKFMEAVMSASRSEQEIASLVSEFSADWIETVPEVSPELKQLHSRATKVARNRIVRRDVNHHDSYLNGRMLMLALMGQYNGVRVIDLESLPFRFFESGHRDTCISDVISKTNGAIKRHGWKIHVVGGVALFGPDLEAEAHRGKKVQICGRVLTQEDRGKSEEMPIRVLVDSEVSD